MVNLNENGADELKKEYGKIIIKSAKEHRTLKSRIAKHKGHYVPHEWDTGISVGKEV